MSLPESQHPSSERPNLLLQDFFEHGLSVDIVNANADVGLLDEARWNIATSYRLFTPKLSPMEIFQLLCEGEYDTPDRSMTLVALGKKKQELMATLRFTFGKPKIEDSDPEPIEAMQLVDIPHWPHRERGLTDKHIAEAGRFSVSPVIQEASTKEEKVLRRLCSAVLLATLIRTGFDIASRRGVHDVYAIMPASIYGLFEMERIPPKLVTVIGEDQLQKTPKANETFGKFPGYWKNNQRQPALCRWDVTSYGKPTAVKR